MMIGWLPFSLDSWRVLVVICDALYLFSVHPGAFKLGF